MTLLRTTAFAACFACALSGLAQTPPIKPQTPDVTVPPPITLPLPPEIAGARPLSIDEAVAIALQQNPTLLAARTNIQAAQGRTQQARAGLFPQFGANASITEQENLRGGTSSEANRFNTGVTVEQLLFDFGRTRNQVRQQSALERATRFLVTGTEQDIALQARVSYLTYEESLRLVRVSEANVENRQRQLRQAEARLESGLGAPGDFVRAKTTLADAVLSLELARNTSTNARVQLAQTLGIDPRTPITLTTDQGGTTQPTETDLDLTRLVIDALRDRPEILEAQQRLEAAGLGVAVARVSNAPSVSVVAGVNARGSDDPLQTQTGSFGIALNWQFGDGGLAAGRTREARALEEAARQNLNAVSQQIISEVGQAYVDYLSAAQRVRTAEVQVANAQELLRISEGRYAGEIGQFLEVTDAQNLLFSAERNLTQARADQMRARARLNRAVGRV